MSILISVSLYASKNLLSDEEIFEFATTTLKHVKKTAPIVINKKTSVNTAETEKKVELGAKDSKEKSKSTNKKNNVNKKEIAPVPPFNYQISNHRIARIDILFIESIKTSGSAESSTEMKKKILEKFKKDDHFPMEPVERRKKHEYRAKVALETLLKKKYPPIDYQKLKTVAAKKYPIYEIGDKIILRYRTSPERIVTVSGIYRKQTRSNVVVDALSIYKEDIINVGPSGKKEIQKFDKFAQKKKRSFYILRKRTNYKTSKIKYTEYIRDRIERIEHNKTNEINEKNGFIFNNRKWTTVENYLSSLIKTFKRKVRRGRLAKLKEKARLDIPKKKDGKDIVESVSAPETMLIADIRNSLNSENTVGSDTMLISDAKGKGQPEKTAEKKIEEKPEKKPKKKSKEKPKKKPEQKTKETPEPDIQEETGGSMGLIIGIIAGILIIAGGIALKLFVLTGDAGTSYYSLEEAKAKFWAQRIVNQTESPYAVFSFETKEQAKQAMLDLSFFKLNPINKEMQCKLSIEYGIHVSELDETRWIAFIGGVKLEHKDWSEAMEHWKEVAGQEEKSEEPHLGEQTQDELMEEFKKAREKKEKLSVSTKIEDDDISDLETSNIEEDDISDLETSDIEKR